MLRRAILIGHNDASRWSNGPLQGVNKDIRDLRDFLLSDHGGAWNQDEIEPHGAPRLVDLRAALARAKATHDFLFIAFSGHGARDPARGSYVWLNDSDTIFIDELARPGPRARRIVALSDACRVRAPAPTPPPIKRTGGDDVSGFPTFDRRYRQRCRETFDAVVGRAEEAVVVMHACSTGESAGDSEHGGTFTRAILRRAALWVDEKRAETPAPSWLWVKGAFRRASIDTAGERYGAQNPELLPSPPPDLPFAIT